MTPSMGWMRPLNVWVPVPKGRAFVSHRGTIVSGSDSRRRQIPDKLGFQRTLIVDVTKGCSAGFPRAPQTHLVFHSWGSFITILAIALRSAGIYRPVPYLTYSGSYLMQAFFQRFLEWIPWKYADNLISELLLFFVLNVLGYAFVIFLLLRIFFPDRSGELPPLTGKK
jgi:hypothetical protein